MAFTELKQHLWMTTPFGDARCIAVIDYGPEDDLLCVCIQQEGEHRLECWQWHNSEIRFMENRSLLRTKANEG